MSLFGKKYKVDYCGEKFAYKNAKDEYRAGEKVTVYYWMIATDTDYSFQQCCQSAKRHMVECRLLMAIGWRFGEYPSIGLMAIRHQPI